MGLVRLFLALVVVADHLFNHVLSRIGAGAVSPIFKGGLNAGFAVMFFFMISGFLISFVLSTKYDDSAGRTIAFYKSRLVRIFSLYWPLLILFAFFFDFTREGLRASAWPDWLGHIFIIGSVFRYCFVDYPDLYRPALVPGLTQAWSLEPELLFYLLAPFLLRRPVLVAVVLFGSFALRLALADPEVPLTVWNYQLLPGTIMFFLLGHVARVSADRFTWLRNPFLGPGLLLLSSASLLIPDWGYYISWDSPRFFVSVFAFALALPSLFYSTKDIHWMNWLGHLSYGVYLLQNGPIWWLRVRARPENFEWLPKGPYSGYLPTAAMCLALIALAAACRYLVEKPTATLLRRLVDHGRLWWSASSGRPAPDAP